MLAAQSRYGDFFYPAQQKLNAQYKVEYSSYMLKMRSYQQASQAMERVSMYAGL